MDVLCQKPAGWQLGLERVATAQGPALQMLRLKHSQDLAYHPLALMFGLLPRRCEWKSDMESGPGPQMKILCGRCRPALRFLDRFCGGVETWGVFNAATTGKVRGFFVFRSSGPNEPA